MKNKPILFIDSGIGGLPYCMDFQKKNTQETVYYLADNKNFPYGPRGKEELTSILITLIKNILNTIQPKIIVLACNTATIAALSMLRQTFPQIPFIGTVPAVKPAALACSNGKVGVLATERTIEDIKSLNLADDTCEIFGVAAPELVDFIEHQFDDSQEERKTEIVRKYIEIFRTAKVDTLVLGCTHFLFLQDIFRSEGALFFKVFDSIPGITKRIEYYLDENNGALRCQPEGINTETRRNIFLVTGANVIESFWEKRANDFGFKLKVLNGL